MVQASEVATIRERWRTAGEPPCAHERTDREYELGGDTGDYACLDCGATWPRSQGAKPRAG